MGTSDRPLVLLLVRQPVFSTTYMREARLLNVSAASTSARLRPNLMVVVGSGLSLVLYYQV